MPTIGNSRILRDDFGLIGHAVHDQRVDGGKWFIHGVYAPLGSHRPSGIRVKVVHPPSSTVTFIGQIYLEVALGLATPGSLCPWAGIPYPRPGTPTFYALVCDDDDLEDDLYDRELVLRSDATEILREGTTITRRYQHEPGSIYRETLILVRDRGGSGEVPANQLDGVGTRWQRVERSLG